MRRALGLEQHGAAVLEQGHAVAVDERPGRGIRSADGDLVGAVGALAAGVARDEQEPVAVVLDEVRRLDRVRRRCRGRRGAAARHRPTRRPLGHSSSTMRMPLQNEPNAIHGVPSSSIATPGSIALKSSPDVGRDHRPAIHPLVIGVVGVERRVRRERDHRRVLAEPRRRVVQVPGAVVLDELGRPEVVDARHGLVDPRGLLVPDLALVRATSGRRTTSGSARCRRRPCRCRSSTRTRCRRPGRAPGRASTRSPDELPRPVAGAHAASAEDHGCREQRAEAEAAPRRPAGRFGGPSAVRRGGMDDRRAAPGLSRARSRSTTPAAGSR